jgi:Predicted membrane protein
MIAAHYQPLWEVVAGTTLGMLAANVPVVFLGARFAHRLPMRVTRLLASALFAALGVLILVRG